MHAGLGCRRGTMAVFFVIARSTVHRKEILIQKASAFSLCGNVWANKRFLQLKKSAVVGASNYVKIPDESLNLIGY